MTNTYIIDCVDTTDSWNNYQNIDKFFVAVPWAPYCSPYYSSPKLP